ncbi:MAG: LCP family protein [Anaerolineales bacterium]
MLERNYLIVRLYGNFIVRNGISTDKFMSLPNGKTSSGYSPTVDPLADTQPSPALTQVHTPVPAYRAQRRKPDRTPGARAGCGFILLAGVIGLLLGGIYLFFPGRTNILILGIDDRQAGAALGRSDTMILTTFLPASGHVAMLSIPRDLWVTVPGQGENRINTAHFFAEADQPGSGMLAGKEVVRDNFGVDVDYAVRLRFDNFMEIVTVLGGLEITLDQAEAGYEAGSHILDAEQSLAFVRDRQGSDDFFRMERGQIFLKALFRALISPKNLPKLPIVVTKLLESVESDIPVFIWPRLGVTLLRSGPSGIEARTITRDMVTPFTTDGGAQVLAPNWDRINPLLLEIFGQ